mgnify:CR=1 FL=1
MKGAAVRALRECLRHASRHELRKLNITRQFSSFRPTGYHNSVGLAQSQPHAFPPQLLRRKLMGKPDPSSSLRKGSIHTRSHIQGV